MLSGLGTVFGVSEEATFGTAAGAVHNSLEAEEGFESIQATRELIEPSMLDGISPDKSQISKGRIRCDGSLEFPLRYDGGWMIFLAHLCGKAIATAGVGPYTHTLDLGAAPDMADKGLTLFLKRAGMVASGTSTTWVYHGQKPTSIEINIPENGLATLSVDLFGKKNAFGAHSAATYPTGSWMKTPSNSNTPTALFSWGGTAYVVRSAKIRIEQGYQIRWDPVDDAMLQPGMNAQRKITASIVAEALDTATASGGKFHDDFTSKTVRAAVITLDGPTAANESFLCQLGDCLITQPVDPHPQSGDVMLSNIELTAYRDGATSAGQIVLTNGSSAAYATS
ncbi:MAG: hypothetical protein HQ519_00085 [Planctomycetes bacterium]|nr:hypothetical protein [Planctomycetota bacterium]